MICGFCYYDTSTWAILILMVITGALRSVIVKLAYQNGFDAPLLVTILYLLGQGLSTFVYLFQKSSKTSNESYTDKVKHGESDNEAKKVQKIKKMTGSTHGLSSKSDEAVMWVHSIPPYFKPLVPAIFNLINSTLRWIALTYISASIAEMLISGLELVLSVVAARLIRKRMVSRGRWLGVAIVTLAVTGIGIIDYCFAEKQGDETEGTRISRDDAAIGIILIVLQCIFSVLQDMAEELFMQAANFPATLLLGMEGFMGLVLALPLYFLLGKWIVEDPVATRELLKKDSKLIAWIFALPFVFLISGIFNIEATKATSAMTRNVWKNVRTALVWILGLVIFYCSHNDSIGEKWQVPQSFYVLLCFLFLTVGIIVYYWNKKLDDDQKRESLPTKEEKEERGGGGTYNDSDIENNYDSDNIDNVYEGNNSAEENGGEGGNDKKDCYESESSNGNLDRNDSQDEDKKTKSQLSG